MVDVTTNINGAIQSGTQTASTITLFMLVILLGLIIMGVVVFFVYKRKFNIDIIFIPFNEQPMMTGLKARDYFTGSGKDYRFKIWGAKRHKIKYNEEAIDPNLITVHKTVNGKIKRLIWMTSDDSGMLIPTKVQPELTTYITKTIDEETGKEVSKTVTSRVLRAKYTDVDVSWLQMEKDKWTNIFKPQDKMVFWGLIVIGVIMLLALGGFLWGVNKNAEIAVTHQNIASEQARSNALMVESLCVITEKCINEDGSPKVFNSVIQI